MKAVQATRSIVRGFTVAIMGLAVVTATADGFAQSYAGLYRWGLEHQLAGWKAESFPLLVDLFILVGEMGLFLLALDGYRLKKRSGLSWIDLLIPASVAVVGWGVSLVFNVGHVQHASTADQVTAGVPPITAMVGLLILFRTIHRYTTLNDHVEAPEKPAEEIILVEAATSVPALNAAEVPTDVRPDSFRQHSPESGRLRQHPKWDEAVKIYTESLNGSGRGLSQRDLADAIGMRNRNLAREVITYVNGLSHEET